jgi:hypothetical protein
MKLNVYVNETMKQVDVPNDMLREAESIYSNIDKDLDQGWQMSRSPANGDRKREGAEHDAHGRLYHDPHAEC